ncbi:MAG TPA: hypothetical protein VMT89_09500 [Candidatus Acidoferrales bacterium]|nr:hypothetical protein [Candidatus Acidoferrales bacterium]
MSAHLDPRRDSARSFFEALHRDLSRDEVLADKQCVRLVLDKAQKEQSTQSRRRFDVDAVFRSKVLFDRVDEAVAGWCRRRNIRTDPFNVFRYEGSERGPTQHEIAIGLARPAIERAFDRLTERAPEIADCRSQVFNQPTKALAPAFRFQHPLPFGAAGDLKYGGSRADFDRSVYRVAMYAATGGDTSRGWRYDCGLLIFYTIEGARAFLGNELHEGWPALHERLWEAGRVWTILL